MKMRRIGNRGLRAHDRDLPVDIIVAHSFARRCSWQGPSRLDRRSGHAGAAHRGVRQREALIVAGARDEDEFIAQPAAKTDKPGEREQGRVGGRQDKPTAISATGSSEADGEEPRADRPSKTSSVRVGAPSLSSA